QRDQGAAIRAELVLTRVIEQTRCTADIQTLLGLDEIRERRAQGGEEGSLGRREPRVLERAAHPAGAELESGDAVFEVLAGPLRQPDVDRLLARDDALRNDARGGRH